MTNNSGLIIRYLLWCNGLAPSEWANKLSDILSVKVDRSKELLLGAMLDEAEEELFVSAVQVNIKEAVFENLVIQDKVDILKENLRFLIKNLNSNQRSLLAQKLNVHQNTITRWVNGSHRPVKSHLEAFIEYLGLPRETDLEVEPFFLSYPPETLLDRKVWLFERIAALSNSKLQAVFPALQLILEEKD